MSGAAADLRLPPTTPAAFRPVLLAFCVLAAALAAIPARLFAGPTHDCSAPAELVQDPSPLPRTAAKVKSKEKLKIVAIGGGSTAGTAAGDPKKAWPQRLAEVLEERFPGLPVEVVNQGMSRQLAQQMLDRFPTDVIAEKPTLVVWETGITDAVQGVEVDEFTHTLQTGVERLREAKLDIILMDMQYSRGGSTVINYERYLEAMRRVADVNDVVLFSRWDVMRHWTETGAFDFEHVPRVERAQRASIYYNCLAERLADTIAWSAR
jgi:acyl-CoA thioesterase I